MPYYMISKYTETGDIRFFRTIPYSAVWLAYQLDHRSQADVESLLGTSGPHPPELQGLPPTSFDRRSDMI